MVNMKILISGGTGLVGKELGKALVKNGHELFVLTRSPEKSIVYTPYPHTPVFWEAAKTAIPGEIMSQMDGVINMAGRGIADKRWTSNYKSKLFNSRVVGTQNLVRAANEHGDNLKFFISTSAVGYYGPTQEEAVTEDAPAANDFLGKLCKAWESPVLHNLESRFRQVILRVGVVLSEKGGALSKMAGPIQAGIGGALGNGQQGMPWIDIDDLVKMFILAVDTSLEGTYNAVAPNPVSNKELTDLIGLSLGCKPGPSVPGFALRMAVGPMASTLLGHQSVSAEKILNAGFYFDCPKIEDSLSLRLIPMEKAERLDVFEQWVPADPKTIFPFFADANNLEKITPKKLQFKILSCSTENVEKDTRIEYQIRLSGIPMTWVTHIDRWEPPHAFSDNQLKGPYKKWHHTHLFEPLAGGTLMTDRVLSIVPMGRFGKVVAGWKVYGDVSEIFAHRHQVIAETFGNSQR